MYTSMDLKTTCILLAVMWASADLDDHRHLCTSRSLLQTHTQRIDAPNGSWPWSKEPAQRTQMPSHKHPVQTRANTQTSASAQNPTDTKTRKSTTLDRERTLPNARTNTQARQSTTRTQPTNSYDNITREPANNMSVAARSPVDSQGNTITYDQDSDFTYTQPSNSHTNTTAGLSKNRSVAADYNLSPSQSAGQLHNVSAVTDYNLSTSESAYTDPGYSDQTLAADAGLQAPADGGKFSEHFNSIDVGLGVHSWLHYFPVYQRHFAQFIGKEVHIVHVGCTSGGDLKMWKDSFGTQAQIYGVFEDPASVAYEEDRIKIFIGNQADPAFWDDFKSKVPRVDIFIDDGGHDVEQNVAAIGNMLPHMSPNGIYVTEGIGEDMYWENADHRFWMYLHLELLTSPAGQSYVGLNQFVSSVHIYPYIMVAELKENSGSDAMIRQLGSASKEPSEARTLTADNMDWSFEGHALPSESEKQAMEASEKPPLSDAMKSDLGSALPWLKWKESGIFVIEEPVDELLESMQPDGWLIVRDPAANFTFSSPWDGRTDIFLNKISARFIALQRGLCCAPRPNRMQELVESVHIYPHLFIAQMLEKRRVLAAPMHGTQWDPVNTSFLLGRGAAVAGWDSRNIRSPMGRSSASSRTSVNRRMIGSSV